MQNANSNHHATKTYRGKPACAGSGSTNPVSTGWNFSCPVCKRSGFSLTNARTPSLTTHIHADDLARGTSTAKPAQAVNTVIRELNYSLTQHTAIRRFALDTNQENYNLLVEAGVSISNSDYLRYSREQGWA